MKLLDSLLDAIVRLEGDALVMHVGEKPYVVTTSASMNAYRGPLAWGQVELSSRVLTPEAVQSMLGQILPIEQRQALDEIGAVEHEIASPHGIADRFTVVAARGGDDIWLELRRTPAEVTQPQPTQPEAAPHEQPAMVAESAAESATGAALQPPPSQALAPVSPGDAVVEPAYDEPQDERPEIEERIPVMDEAGSHEADRVEHLVISVGGAGTDAREHVPLDSVPNDAIEVVDDEPQGVPSEDEVDEMLAATAAALLTSGLESGDVGAERFDADSMHVVDEESPAPYDLTQVEALADADAAHARADEELADEVTVVETDVEHLAAVIESEVAPEVMARDQVEEIAPAPQAATDIEEPPQAATGFEDPTPVAEAEPPAAVEEPAQPLTAVEEAAQPVMFVEEPAQPVTSIEEPAEPVTPIEESAEPVTSIEEAAEPGTSIEEPAQPLTLIEETVQPVAAVEEAAQPLTPIEEAAQPVTPIEEVAQPHTVSEEPVQPVMVAEQAQPVSTPEEPAAPATVVTEAAAAPRDDRAHVELPVEVPRPEIASTRAKKRTRRRSSGPQRSPTLSYRKPRRRRSWRRPHLFLNRGLL